MPLLSRADKATAAQTTPGENPPPRVLSLQYSHLGIATYSRGMREFFAGSDCVVDSRWFDQDKALPAQVARRALLLDDKWAGTWARKRNLDLHRLRQDLGMACLARSLAVRRLRAADYSALHFHTQPLAYLCTDLMRRTPTVIQLDMTAMNHAREGRPRRWQWTFAPNRRLDASVFAAAHRIVAWSEWAARSLRDDYQIPPEKIRVIYPGVDPARFPPPPRSSECGDAPVRLLFAGYDFARKGGHDLLDVFTRHFADRAELHLMTAEAFSCDHPRVFVHRGVSAYTAEWFDLFRRADVFVMPTFVDGLPMVCLEAMAMSLPVVSTPVGAIPEAVTDGKTGLLVSPGNREELTAALRRLLDDKGLRRGMGLLGRARALERFDAQVNFRALESVFRETAASRPPGAKPAS